MELRDDTLYQISDSSKDSEKIFYGGGHLLMQNVATLNMLPPDKSINEIGLVSSDIDDKMPSRDKVEIYKKKIK